MASGTTPCALVLFFYFNALAFNVATYMPVVAYRLAWISGARHRVPK